jgi:hypothetical protein
MIRIMEDTGYNILAVVMLAIVILCQIAILVYRIFFF